MNIKKLEELHNERFNAGKNSIALLLPYAKNMLNHMSSEELWEFISLTIVRKQYELESNLLGIDDEQFPAFHIETQQNEE
tara:strand:+ start:2186 stop:2425 length:240 start_codon:yes stop_codon:yes gene_type:complete